MKLNLKNNMKELPATSACGYTKAFVSLFVGHLCCHDNNPSFTGVIVYFLSKKRATVYENGYLRTGVTNIAHTVKLIKE